MSRNMHPSRRGFLALALTISLTAGSLAAPTAVGQDAGPPQELDLIQILESDAPAAEKAITCKRLAVYGSPKAVPALAPLLADPELNSWARIALEAIPGQAANAALRNALNEVEGQQLIGVINSIGFRGDRQAVRGLIRKLNGYDPQVSGAAAEALGHIGGDQAAKALGDSLETARGQVQSAAAYGMVLCAEGYMAQGDHASAITLYDAVRNAPVPEQRILEATRGAVLARRTDGIPLLLELLRSPDRGLFFIGLRTARELPGREVSEALAQEIIQEEPARQAQLLLALADRDDASVLPAVLLLAREGAAEPRVVAIQALERLGNLSCVPVLLEAAIDEDPAIAGAAVLTLTRLEGKAFDDDLLSRLPEASGATLKALIDLAAQRYLVQAIPFSLEATKNPDAAVRQSAIQALGVLAGEEQVVELVTRLQDTDIADERAALEKALTAICGRIGRAGVPALLPLAANSNPAVRIIAIHLLASVGGSAALDAVVASVKDSEESVRDEAVRTLSSWPRNWSEDVAVADTLLALAKSGTKYSYKVQGLRGYLLYVQETAALNAGEKLAVIQQVLPLIERPEELRQAIAVLSNLPTVATLEFLMQMADNEAVIEETCMALVNVAAQNELPADAKQIRRQALELVNQKSQNAETKKRARAIMGRL